MTTSTKILDTQFWNQQYIDEKTGWDLGMVSPPLQQYINQLTDKHISILIPGCGNAYEAAYLLQQGFTNVTLIDIAPHLTEKLLQQFSGNKHIKIITGDFFKHQGQYDLIIEQTFFCALNPSLRNQYAQKMYELLKPEGKLAGLLFNRTFDFEGPPFGGSQQEYEQLFQSLFTIKILDIAYNSVKPRQGNELFIILEKQ
jgi:methyl halide transferase